MKTSSDLKKSISEIHASIVEVLSEQKLSGAIRQKLRLAAYQAHKLQQDLDEFRPPDKRLLARVWKFFVGMLPLMKLLKHDD